MKTSDAATVLLRQAVAEIRHQRHELNILRAQMFVVQAFHAALLGPPRGEGMSPDLAWEIDRHLQSAKDQEQVS